LVVWFRKNSSLAFGPGFGGLEHFVVFGFIHPFLDGLSFGFIIGGQAVFDLPAPRYRWSAHSTGRDAGVIHGGIAGIVAEELFFGLDTVRGIDAVGRAPGDKGEFAGTVFDHIRRDDGLPNCAAGVELRAGLSSNGCPFPFHGEIFSTVCACGNWGVAGRMFAKCNLRD